MDEKTLSALICCKCKEFERAPRQRWCIYCRRAYYKNWRKVNDIRYANFPQHLKRRENARAAAKKAQKKGRLIPTPCVRCGNPKSEKHHTDYSKSMMVTYLCRACHLREGRGGTPWPKPRTKAELLGAQPDKPF